MDFKHNFKKYGILSVRQPLYQIEGAIKYLVSHEDKGMVDQSHTNP